MTPINVMREFRCDRCQRTPEEIIAAEKPDFELPPGMFFDERSIRSRYGWIALHPEHLTDSGMAHNQLPTESIVLCASCSEAFADFLATKEGVTA